MTTGRINQVKCENSVTPYLVLSAETISVKGLKQEAKRKAHGGGFKVNTQNLPEKVMWYPK